MPGALPIFFALAVGVLLSLLSPYSFLDRDLYLWIFGLFVLLFADEARRLKRAQRSKSEGPEDRPESFGAPEGISLGTAAGQHFVLVNDIVRLAAADDYTEAFLTDGRTVLHPEPLQRLLERLPASFLRIHRSHAINLSHLRSFRKGPSSSVVLSDESTAPVSRRSVAKLVAALGN
jgi:DNA-binding LytR/AlgR family response regulator